MCASRCVCPFVVFLFNASAEVTIAFVWSVPQVQCLCLHVYTQEFIRLHSIQPRMPGVFTGVPEDVRQRRREGKAPKRAQARQSMRQSALGRAMQREKRQHAPERAAQIQLAPRGASASVRQQSHCSATREAATPRKVPKTRENLAAPEISQLLAAPVAISQLQLLAASANLAASQLHSFSQIWTPPAQSSNMDD